MSRFRESDPPVRLRPVEPGDLPRFFEMQRDPESIRMAMVNPRAPEAFAASWAQALADPATTARAVLLGGELVGYASCFPVEGGAHVGYWIDRAAWGKGVATSALRLLLGEVAVRPLAAVVASGNAASLRVLSKCGFAVERVRHAPATDRYPACEVVEFLLGAGNVESPLDAATGG